MLSSTRLRPGESSSRRWAGVSCRPYDDDRIEAPYLQLVMSRLWEVEARARLEAPAAGDAHRARRRHADRPGPPRARDGRSLAPAEGRRGRDVQLPRYAVRIEDRAPDPRSRRLRRDRREEAAEVLRQLAAERIVRASSENGCGDSLRDLSRRARGRGRGLGCPLSRRTGGSRCRAPPTSRVRCGHRAARSVLFSLLRSPSSRSWSGATRVPRRNVRAPRACGRREQLPRCESTDEHQARDAGRAARTLEDTRKTCFATPSEPLCNARASCERACPDRALRSCGRHIVTGSEDGKVRVLPRRHLALRSGSSSRAARDGRDL